MKKSRFTDKQIFEILQEHESGLSTRDVCCRHEISSATLCKWKSEYGGLDLSDLKRLKGLELENAKLKKLCAAILCVIEAHDKLESTRGLGAVRLNKILWVADVRLYKKTGRSITGEKYIKKDRGPVVSQMTPALEYLHSEGALKIHRDGIGIADISYTRFTLVNRDSYRDILDEDYENLLVNLTKIFTQEGADEISELSHDRVWELTYDGEEIPLYATLVNKGTIDAKTMARAKEDVEQRIAAGTL